MLTEKKYYGFIFIGSILFFVFTYNSSYGYDGLEYLVIGRSLLDGYPFYTFIPSKSFGLYYLTALFLSLGKFDNHFAVSVFISLVYFSTLIFTFLIVKKIFTYRVAMISSALIGICGLFMEMNFLQPAGFVYLMGLGGYYFITKGVRDDQMRNFLLGGLWIGVGFWFKSTAGFYIVAVLVFLFLSKLFNIQSKFNDIWKRIIYFLTGTLIAVCLPMIYFALSNRLIQHLEWTYYFPLFKYPSNCNYLGKFITKLSWHHFLFIITVMFSMNNKIRKNVYANPCINLAFFMGLLSMVALFKSQATHFVFPSAAFCSIYIAFVWETWMKLNKRSFRNKMSNLAFIIMFGILICASVYLYNPKVLNRFLMINDYSGEREIGTAIKRMVPPSKKAIFFTNSMLFYWVSHRYPNLPCVHFDYQPTYWLNKHPKILTNALLDPDLVMVECDFKWDKEADRIFLNKDSDVLIRFKYYLHNNFIMNDHKMAPYTLWTKQQLK